MYKDKYYKYLSFSHSFLPKNQILLWFVSNQELTESKYCSKITKEAKN